MMLSDFIASEREEVTVKLLPSVDESIASAPSSMKGIFFSFSICRNFSFMSMPVTLAPRDANASARGSPTLPMPITDRFMLKTSQNTACF